MKIDYREHKILKDFPKAEICNLEVGDIIYEQLCIERKSIEDFISSLIDRRLFNQAINMKQNYKYPIIIVEGDLKLISEHIYFTEKKVSMKQIRGAVASLYIKYEVPVLFCSTPKNFKELVERLKVKIEDINNGLLIKGQNTNKLLVFNPAINKTTADPKLQVLLQIPGIGETKAKKILDHYGLFSNLGFMERPQGVSDKDIEQIKEVLK